MNAFVILATIAWGLWGFCQKNASGRMSVVDVQFASFICGIFVMPLYFQFERHDWTLKGVDPKGFAWACAAHILSVSASYFYLRALKTAALSTVTLTTSVYPVVTIALAILFLGERITIGKALGIPVVIFGVWLFGRN